MDDIFGDVNDTYDQWMDSIDDQNETQSTDESTPVARKTTTFEKVYDLSPIAKRSREDTADNSVYDFDQDLSFDRSKSYRKYSPNRRPFHFSPAINTQSTPKPSKSRVIRRRADPKSGPKLRKKYRKRVESDISLWDKAMSKSAGLRQWVDSFNDEMKKVESTDLSVSKRD